MRRILVVPFLVVFMTLALAAGVASAQTLDVMLFQTGYGIEWVKEAAEEYEAENPDVEIEITASPEIWNQLRPRFIAGNPPDLFSPGWEFDIWSAYLEGQLMSFNDALETHNYQGTQPWKEDFDPNFMEAHSYQGDIYGIPYFVGLGSWAWWYNAALFEEKGWELPKTLDDLYDLNEKVKAEGLSLFALQGLYPNYYAYGIWLPYVQLYGGIDAINAAFNMEPGAWNSEPFLKAAQQTVRMIEEGMFLPGTLGLTHTQAQTQFFLGNAVFIPCGSWLEAEMRDIIPEDFVLRAFNYPAVQSGEGDPTAVQGTADWSANFYVPSKAEHPDLAVDFLKYLTQERIARDLVANNGVLTAIKGSNDAVQSAALNSVVELANEADLIWNAAELDAYYPAFVNEMWNSYQALFNGELSARQFVNQVEAAAEKLRNSDTTLKPIHF